MAQLDGRKTSPSFKTPKAQTSPTGTSTSFKTPKSTNSPTFQQLLQGDATIWPSSPLTKHNDFEGLQSPSRKARVILRVKEKARKWRNSLSIKRRQSQSTNSPNRQSTSSWGVTLDDHENEEDNPEYLGAPMYESEKAPEDYKATAKHHHRAVPVPSEKHVLQSSIRNSIKKQESGTNSNKTMTESATEKLAPAFGAVSDATQTIASRIAGLTVDTSGPTDTENNDGSVTKISPRAANAYGSDKAESSMEGRVHGQSDSPSKGISVKEYLMKKLEPGEAEKALSQVITETISPRRTPHSDQVGMMEIMKEAVTSYFRTEPSSDSEIMTNIPPVKVSSSSTQASSSSGSSISPTKKNPSPRKLVYTPQNPSSPNYKATSPSQNPRLITKENSTSHTNSSSALKDPISPSHVPMSTSHAEEENNGRILQAN